MEKSKYKETKAERALRVRESENGVRFKPRVVISKKIYSRKKGPADSRSFDLWAFPSSLLLSKNVSSYSAYKNFV